VQSRELRSATAAAMRRQVRSDLRPLLQLISWGQYMKPLPVLLVAAIGTSFSASAFSDCVDFNPKRAEAAAAALTRNPPTAAQLGVPSLEGLTLDAARTSGDPKCDGGPPYSRFFYTTNLSFAELIARWHPVIRRRTELDGMNREWFRNPMHGNSLFFTSGTRVEFAFGREREFSRMTIHKAKVVGALATENQPYTVSEIVEGTPWPGGAKGPRQFMRADQGGGAQSVAPATMPATAAPAGAAPAETGASPPANCPPRSAQSGGGSAAQRAGTELGGAIGGGFGRNLGSAVGGMLGALGGGSPTSQAPADPNCP
jgi:hypothetical protein